MPLITWKNRMSAGVAATGEISKNVRQASQGTAEIAANQTGKTSITLLNAAKQLSEQADKLLSQVGIFPATLRTV